MDDEEKKIRRFDTDEEENKIDYEEMFLCLLQGLCDLGIEELKRLATEPHLYEANIGQDNWRYYAHVELGNVFSMRKWLKQKIEYRICEIFVCEMQAQAYRQYESIRKSRADAK